MNIKSIIILFAIISCAKHNNEDKFYWNVAPAVFIGYDVKNEGRTCAVPPKKLDCPILYEDQKAFQEQCLKNGFEVYLCACNDYLCSQTTK